MMANKTASSLTKALGRRMAIANSGEAFTFTNANDLAAFNLYGYNGRSEVTSATRYWGTNTGTTTEPVAGQEYAYAYDPIGNRITSAEGDTDRTATYTANALNQYTQRTVPGVKELAGTAITNASVTVNGLATDRHGPWWHHAFEVDNAASTAYTQAVVCAVYNPPGTNDPDVVTSATGHVFVAETPEALTYDDDGNLLSDGRFNYAWDAENRLIGVTTRADLPAAAPRIRLTHAYDYQSRRLITAREEWNGSAWQSAGTNRYVYDGWNFVTETRATSPANTNYYVWGLDLSGTLQGAGGIGGLLTVRKRLEDGTGIVRNYDVSVTPTACRRGGGHRLIRLQGCSPSPSSARGYLFPLERRGGLCRGVPTAHAAPGVADVFNADNEPPPVWPDADGSVRGLGVIPLYRAAPKAARRDVRLYELLAVADLLRGGRARERAWAELRVEEILKTAEPAP